MTKTFKLTKRTTATEEATEVDPEPTPSTLRAWDWAGERLLDLGFEAVPRPEGKPPRVPMTLGDITPDQLMDMIAAYAAWYEYAALQAGAAEALEDDVEADLKLAEARYMIGETDAGEAKVTVARARMNVDPKVIELRQELRKARAVRKALQTYLNTYERTSAMLSRELTKRQIYMPYEGRR